MPGSIEGSTQPWFTINEFISEDVTASTDIDVNKITAVAFDADVGITIGGLTTVFALAAGMPIGIDATTSTIQVDTNCFMYAMGGR